MPRRNLQNYIGLTRLARSNNKYSAKSAEGKQKKPTASALNTLAEFFTSNVLGWIKHDWRVPKPFDYPTIQNSVHPLENSKPIHITIAADWANDTLQAQYVSDVIKTTDPDYTVHLGDTYFSGVTDELNFNFGDGKEISGIWPRGKSGSFALCGNHEMFSSGLAYLCMITNPLRRFGIRDPLSGTYTGQEAPCFCLHTKHWIVLGLDTGYQSLRTGIHLNSTNTQLNLPDPVYKWIEAKVLPVSKNKGIIILTHHQYVTAFNTETEFHNPAAQLKKLFRHSDGVLWIWGHEHRFSMYGKNQLSPDHIPTFGRCIGNGSMPDEHTRRRHVTNQMAISRKLVVYDERTADSIPLSRGKNPPKRDVGFNGFATIALDGSQVEIQYYAAYRKDDGADKGKNELLIHESWEVNQDNGQIKFINATDFTSSKPPNEERTTYFGDRDPLRVGK